MSGLLRFRENFVPEDAHHGGEMSLTIFRHMGYVVGALFFGALVVCGEAAAQNLVSSPVAPPPLRLVSSPERAQLTRETDLKKRVRTAVELAEARLRRAEELTTLQQPAAATDELAAYQGILEEAFEFMRQRGRNDTKERDLYKRLEMAMRPHGVRLEAIRRATPSEYAVYVKSVYNFTRDARTEALNSFYGETVLREPRGTAAAQTRPTQP